MSSSLTERVEQACQELATASAPVTFDAVADLAGIGRATLYRRAELRAVVEEHRQQTREAHTLTGLTVQLDQLRSSLEAVAAKVRRHERNSASSGAPLQPAVTERRLIKVHGIWLGQD